MASRLGATVNTPMFESLRPRTLRYIVTGQGLNKVIIGDAQRSLSGLTLTKHQAPSVERVRSGKNAAHLNAVKFLDRQLRQNKAAM